MEDSFRERIERRRDFLLRFRAMHDVCGMTWADCAAVYEKETGRPIKENALRKKVARAVGMDKFVHVYELPTKIVVSASELTFRGCVMCSLRRTWNRIKKVFSRDERG